MSMENENNTSSLVESIEIRLRATDNILQRRNEFCMLMDIQSSHPWPRVLQKIMNNKSVFPGVKDTEYFLKIALKENSSNILQILEANNPSIHEAAFVDGKSTPHYLADLELSWERNDTNMSLMVSVLKKAEKNCIDVHGFSYFHAACVCSDEIVQRFVDEGVDVNLDTWKCSPLHIAVQHRRKEIVEILLENGANPNQLDREMSTPLHALSRVGLCDCALGMYLCDYRRPVEEIVHMLIKKGANIEARNKYGDTPLQAAMSCFDVELARTLMKHGANLESLNEDRIFGRNFESIELKHFPLTLNIIEMFHLLLSVGYEVSLLIRLRMLKCWMRIRGNDTDHLIPEKTDCEVGYEEERENKEAYFEIGDKIHIYKKFGFFIKQEALDYMHKQREKLKLDLREDIEDESPPEIIQSVEEYERPRVAKLNDIKVNDDTSLYQLCQMSYDRGYSVLKKTNNLRVPPINVHHCYVSLIVKRHLANILIRPQLELFAADLFMTDYCKLNLPHTVCRIIAEKMSYEELFRLCEQTCEESLIKSLSAQQSKKPHVQDQIHERNEENFSTSPVLKRQRLNDD
ncbi:hypothetical protein TKK_0008516 [Trichogramma kaykai]